MINTNTNIFPFSLHSAGEYLSTMETLPIHLKRDSSVPKLLNLVMKGGGAQGLDRTLGNLLRMIPKAQTYDFQAFLNMDGLGVLASWRRNNASEKCRSRRSDNVRRWHVKRHEIGRSVCSRCKCNSNRPPRSCNGRYNRSNWSRRDVTRRISSTFDNGLWS